MLLCRVVQTFKKHFALISVQQEISKRSSFSLLIFVELGDKSSGVLINSKWRSQSIDQYEISHLLHWSPVITQLNHPYFKP